MAISTVYSNSGTWSGSDIITSVNMRNSEDNIHIIDDSSVIIVSTTDTQVYTDSGSGYTSQLTYSDTSDIIGLNNEFILNNNLYIYNTNEPTSNTRWVTGSNTRYSLSLGSLGSLTDVALTPGINAIEALNEIRTSLLALNINNLDVSLPSFTSDVSPNNSSVNLSGYEIVVNTGSTTNEITSFTINDVAADGSNIIHNYEYETDGAGTSGSTIITLTEPDGIGTITLSVVADSIDDDNTDEIGDGLVTLINNTTEVPNNYSATYDSTLKKITFTSVNPFDSNLSELWTANVTNGTITGNLEGDINFGTSSITTSGVINETFNISAPDLYTKTINGSPLFSKVIFTGGTDQTFSNNLNSVDSAIEFKDALNSSLSGYITASIDSLDSNKVIWTTSIQDDIGLDITFSDSNIVKSITQGILGTTQSDIDNAGKTNIQLTKPGSSSINYNRNYIGFVPTLSGAVNNIQDIVDDINTEITDWNIEKDQPLTNQIRFTSVNNEYVSNIYKLIITNNTGTGNTLGNFSTGIGNATIDALGGSTPNYYGLRSVILANKDVFSNNTSDYSWFNTTTNSSGTILPGYKVETTHNPRFTFDGEDINNNPQLIDGYFEIVANSNGQYVIDSEALTIAEIYNIPVDTPDTVLNGSEMVYYSTKLYLAYRVNNDTEITSLSLTASDTGATIYTNPNTTYTLTDSNTDTIIASYIYKWNGTAWVKES